MPLSCKRLAWIAGCSRWCLDVRVSVWQLSRRLSGRSRCLPSARTSSHPRLAHWMKSSTVFIHETVFDYNDTSLIRAETEGDCSQ